MNRGKPNDSAQHQNAAQEPNNRNISRAAYSLAEFVKRFGRSQTWAYRRLYEGAIDAVKIGERLMIPVGEEHKLLAAHPVSISEVEQRILITMQCRLFQKPCP